MSKRNLRYNKTNGERELFAPKEKAQASSVPPHFSAIDGKAIPAKYAKADGTLSYDIVCVISGGTDRERNFLNELERKRTFKRLNVIFLSSPHDEGGLTPRMVKEKFDDIYSNGELRMRGHTIKKENIDKVYMFTDVDHYDGELRNILSNQSDKESPIWIISNPCFEIWIYFCFRNDPDTDLVEVRRAVASQRAKILKNVNGRFNGGGGLDPRKAFEHLEEGISNSESHYSESAGMPDLMTTQMHVFAKDVIKRLGDEYCQWLEQKQELRLKFST